MAASIAPLDIVPDTRDVALGDGWFPLETYRGQRFRWAENDVTVLLSVLDSAQAMLRLVVEPGPGLEGKPLELSAKLDDGTDLGTVTASSKQVVTFSLPPIWPRAYRVTLHSVAQGRAMFNDARVLNFRVFELGVERRVDVLPSWATAGKGFYPLESLGGSTFRWASNDAEIVLHPARGTQLVFDVEPGPGVSSKPFTMVMRTAAGTQCGLMKISSRTTVRLPLDGVEGDRIVLHTDDGGQLVKTDPRLLNFRLFAAQR